jgi:hypothetical protein
VRSVVLARPEQFVCPLVVAQGLEQGLAAPLGRPPHAVEGEHGEVAVAPARGDVVGTPVGVRHGPPHPGVGVVGRRQHRQLLQEPGDGRRHVGDEPVGHQLAGAGEDVGLHHRERPGMDGLGAEVVGVEGEPERFEELLDHRSRPVGLGRPAGQSADVDTQRPGHGGDQCRLG